MFSPVVSRLKSSFRPAFVQILVLVILEKPKYLMIYMLNYIGSNIKCASLIDCQAQWTFFGQILQIT